MTTAIDFDAASSHSWIAAPQHTILRLKDSEEPAFRSLVDSEGISCIDAIQSQLRDLIEVLAPGGAAGASEAALIEKEIAGHGGSEFAYGLWVYYPWRKAVVHVLPPNRYELVRSNRNRDKITLDEQQQLRRKRVGVVGLSVGHCCALTIAQEGLCGELRLADHDTLSLSNLNRLRTSLINLERSKTAIAHEEIAELDPYLDVSLFDQGITEENLEAFCFQNGKLDLLVEECDDLVTKFRVREFAREHGIPVLMETNDRGMVDVERYDLEPSRELFHGLTGEHSAQSVAEMGSQERFAVLFAIVGGESNLSERLRQSFPQIGSELVSYPQLSSDVHLGGATTAHVARRILLGEYTRSGRFHIDLDELFTGMREECLTTNLPQ